MWGDTGREVMVSWWLDLVGVGRCAEMWGDVGRCGAMWGDAG